MLSFIKRRSLTLAILLGFLVVVLGSYFTLFTLAGNRKAPPHREPTRQPAETAAGHTVSLDADNDGIPDAAELQTFTDRENFRKWFTAIAARQFYQPSPQWNAEQRDCAGLVRFAWREALRRHDRPWFQKMGPGYGPVAPDVVHYNLAQGPLGEKLFRTNFGSYKDGDGVTGSFSEFADARSLKSFNTRFISRDRHQAEPGDLLFYYQPWVQKYPYHVMIFLGSSAGNAGADWVVYHTGSSPLDEGAVKLVELAVLDHHPNKRWRPVADNSNFLGFFRLKILD